MSATIGLLLLALLAALLYWLLIITEGVYLGRRLVVYLYDRMAHNYDDIKQYEDEAERFFVVRPLLYRLQSEPAPRILDVATGTGRLPFYMLQAPRFHGRLVAVEPATRMLQQARQKLAPFRDRVQLVQQTAVPLPFPTATFHAVTCLEALEFFPSTTAALAEMHRVLSPGGLLLVTRRRGWEAKTFIGRYQSAGQFEAYLRSLGFTDVETVPWQIDYDQVFAYKES